MALNDSYVKSLIALYRVMFTAAVHETTVTHQFKILVFNSCVIFVDFESIKSVVSNAYPSLGSISR